MSSSNFLEFVKEVSTQEEYLVLDTETSGLKGEIVELSIVSYKGRKETVIFDSTLKPKKPIDPDSINVHHVTEERCANSPTWPNVVEKIKRLMNGKLVVTYNALFDRRAFHHTDASWGLPKTPWKEIGKWRCAMYATSDLLCVGRLRWWKLSDAARYLELDLSDITLHSSLGDTILAGRVVLALLDFFRGKRSIGVS